MLLFICFTLNVESVKFFFIQKRFSIFSVFDILALLWTVFYKLSTHKVVVFLKLLAVFILTCDKQYTVVHIAYAFTALSNCQQMFAGVACSM